MQRLGKDGRVSAALLSAMDGVRDGLDVSFSKEVAKRRAALEHVGASRTIDVQVFSDMPTGDLVGR